MNMNISVFRFNLFQLLLVFITAALLVSSCVVQPVYDKNLTIKSEGWHINDSLVFPVLIEDTLSSMNFYLNLRHTTEYEFSNIYLFVNSHYPNGQRSRDTIEILLAEKNGEWFGSGFGKIRDNRVLLKQGVVFPLKGLYEFSFIQAMRVETLQEVEDLGIRIEKMQD